MNKGFIKKQKNYKQKNITFLITEKHIIMIHINGLILLLFFRKILFFQEECFKHNILLIFSLKQIFQIKLHTSSQVEVCSKGHFHPHFKSDPYLTLSQFPSISY